MNATLQYPKETKARKDHQCSLCYDKIPNKTVYIASTSVYDGEIGTWRIHKRCNTLVDKLNMFDDCYYDEGLSGEDFRETISEFYYSTLLNTIEETVREQYRETLGELTKVKWRDKFWYVIRHFARIDEEFKKEINNG